MTKFRKWTRRPEKIRAIRSMSFGRATSPSGIDDPVNSYGMKIAADGENLVLAYRKHNTLRWINPSTGAKVRDVTIDKPQDVAADGGGTVYALSGNTVVAVDRSGKISTVIGAGTLVAPAALDYDRVNKQIVVADGGSDQRVRRFALDGKLVASYGRQGGRRDGAYEPKDFRDVSDLTCDNAGGFYAVESDYVRRIVHIRADGGVAKQWFGGAPFFAVASVDPSAPREVWYAASYTTMAVLDLDIETGKWTMTHSYSMPVEGFGDGLFPSVGRFPVWRVRRQGGAKYLIHESPAAILRVDEAGRKLLPVALASCKGPGSGTKAYPGAAINAAMAKRGLASDDPGSDGFTWSDTNGNGELDPEEFRFHNVAAPISYCAFDDNFNVYIGYFQASNYAWIGKRWLLFDFQGSAYVKLPNLAPAGSATPVWDWSRLERSRAKVPADIHVPAVAARWDARGGVTLAFLGELNDRHGFTWPDSQAGCAHLLRALPDGTAWTVSKHDSPGMPPATVLRYPTYFPGTTHGCIIACDRDYYGATAWTEDGLYAGFFLDRHADDLPAWAYDPNGRGMFGLLCGNDWECGGSVTELSDGSVLWIPRAASGRSAVFRVRGWDNWFRDSGKISLAERPAAASADGNGLKAVYFRRAKGDSAQSVKSRIDSRLWFQNAPPIQSWAAGPCPGISANETFAIRWTGRLVAPLSENFWLRVYNETLATTFVTSQGWRDGASFARVWLSGVLVIDRSKGAPTGGAFESAPIHLEAGRSYDLKVQYVSPGAGKPEFSLSWASNTKEWQRIPTAYLHADEPPPTGPVVRVAAEKMDEKTATLGFSVESPLSEAMTVRYRATGTDYVPRAGEVTIAAGASSARVVVTRETGPVEIALEPDVAYRGDGTAGTVVKANNPVAKGLVAYYPLNEVGGKVVHDCIGSHDARFEVWPPPPVPCWLPAGGKIAGAMEFDDPGVGLHLSRSEGCRRFHDGVLASHQGGQRTIVAVLVGSLARRRSPPAHFRRMASQPSKRVATRRRPVAPSGLRLGSRPARHISVCGWGRGGESGRPCHCQCRQHCAGDE